MHPPPQKKSTGLKSPGCPTFAGKPRGRAIRKAVICPVWGRFLPLLGAVADLGKQSYIVISMESDDGSV
jgi:hypothetical protein